MTQAGMPEGSITGTDALYRLLVESVRDYAIFALDATGHVLTWNPGAQRFKGYTADEIVGQHFSVFYPQEDIDAGKPDMELVVAEAEGRFEDEGWRLRKDGSRFWANVVITALFQNGVLVGFAKVTRDLTERRQLQLQAIEDARRLAEAEAANRAKSEFLATMSHELRTPLNAIGGYVDLLSLGIRGPVTAEQLDDLDRIQRSQQHLLGIINDLLNFSRMEAGQLSYHPAHVPVRDILRAVERMTQPLADAKRVDLNWPKRLRATVYVDAPKTEQILLNLLTNAIKFTPSGGRIDVTCTTDPATASISVADTGPGIPADRLEDIFDPFVQVGRSHSSSHEGTGLGLAISRDLASGLGGALTVRSEVGSGSVFTLTLPRNPEAAVSWSGTAEDAADHGMVARVETERRFLVRVGEWSRVAAEASREHMVQIYLTADGLRTVRVRLTGDDAVLTVKGPSANASRTEIECAIDAGAVRSIAKTGLHAGQPVEKTRSTLRLGSLTWQVDQFEGENSGLVIAEVEHDEGLHSRADWDSTVDGHRPDWLGREITDDARFSNSSLAVRPFAHWPREERDAIMRELQQ